MTEVKDESTPNKESVGLASIYQQFRWRILLTWFLVFLEGVVWVLLPAILGRAIDSVLIGQWAGVIGLLVLLLVGVFIGTGRRLYDTRVYANIYTRVATSTVKQQKLNDTSLSVTVTRAQLVQELIDFFEYDLPEGFIALVAIIGALIMLPLFELRVFFACLLGTALIILILASVFLAAQSQNATTGSIFAVVTYVTNYAEGVFMLPLIFQQYVRLKEISQRLQQGS